MWKHFGNPCVWNFKTRTKRCTKLIHLYLFLQRTLTHFHEYQKAITIDPKTKKIKFMFSNWRQHIWNIYMKWKLKLHAWIASGDDKMKQACKIKLEKKSWSSKKPIKFSDKILAIKKMRGVSGARVMTRLGGFRGLKTWQVVSHICIKLFCAIRGSEKKIAYTLRQCALVTTSSTFHRARETMGKNCWIYIYAAGLFSKIKNIARVNIGLVLTIHIRTWRMQQHHI